MENLKFVGKLVLVLAIMTMVAMCAECRAQGNTLVITETPTQVGVSIEAAPLLHNGVDLQPDSIILFWSCDPYQGGKNMNRQELLVGDTVWFPSNQFLIGQAFVCYPVSTLPWKASFSSWTAHSQFRTTNNILHIAQEQPSIEINDINQQGFQVNSNSQTTRVMILHPVYGQVYYNNFIGVEGQTNNFTINKPLNPGWYTVVIRGKYSNLCKDWVTYSQIITVN